jgi:ankyrin repeat protein
MVRRHWREPRKKGHEPTVKLLIGKGAELNSKNENGRTPVSWAAGNARETTVKLLLEKGAESDSNGQRWSDATAMGRGE